MNFSQKFVALRKGAGLSQEEAAEKLGVSRQAISRWEQGTAYPDSFNLLQISKLFGVSSDYLIDDNLESVDTPQRQPEVAVPEQGGDDSRLKRIFYPCFIAAAIAGMLFEVVGAVVALAGNVVAAITLVVLGSVILAAAIVAFAVIFCPTPVPGGRGRGSKQTDKTSFKFSLAVCFHGGALVLELVGLALLFSYSEAILTYLLTGFGVFLSLAGIIIFECSFRKMQSEERKALRKRYYRISVWLFSPFLITTLFFAIALNGGGRSTIVGVIIGSSIIYIAVCVTVTLLLREKRSK